MDLKSDSGKERGLFAQIQSSTACLKHTSLGNSEMVLSKNFFPDKEKYCI